MKAMENNPKISVVVPVYNAEKNLERCINSIYAQTFTDYEIILVNDGSKDNSLAVCNEYAKKDSRITVIDKENGGAGSARNMGIEEAKGEYLAFPDSDDWFEPEMYETLYNLAKKGDYDIVFSGVNYYKQDSGKPVYSRTQNCDVILCDTKEDLRKNVMTFFPTSTIFDVPWNKLYKRSVAIENNVRYSDTKRCQDAMFNIDFYNASQSAVSTDKAFYNYIENTVETVQRKFPKNYINTNIMYYTHLISILKDWGMYEGDIKLHYDTSFVIGVYETINMFDNPVWAMSKSEQKEYVSGILNRNEITGFLADADIREDEKRHYETLKNKDMTAILKEHRKEKIKDALRKNKIIMGAYRLIKH